MICVLFVWHRFRDCMHVFICILYLVQILVTLGEVNVFLSYFVNLGGDAVFAGGNIQVSMVLNIYQKSFGERVDEGANS